MVAVWQEYSGLFLDGLQLTIVLALLTFAIAFVIGALIAAFRVSPVPPLQRAGAFYVGTFRNTPLAVLLVLAFFGLPKVGIRFDNPEETWAVIVLSLYTGAYLAEAIRSGINAVDRGQAEAARAIGMNFRQVLGVVILPQAIRTVVAPITNLFIANLKNTSVLAILSVFELTKWAREVANRSARPVEALTIAVALYLLLILPTGYLFGRLERRLAFKR